MDFMAYQIIAQIADSVFCGGAKMIKIICDHCGAEIMENENIGHVNFTKEAPQKREACVAEGWVLEKMQPNPDYCMKCIDEIRQFIATKPIAGLAPEPIPGGKEEPVPEPEPKPKAKAKPTTKPPDILSAMPESDKPKRKPGRRKINIGKILALKNAGWSYTKIGEEMGMSATDVGNAIWRYKKKGEQNEKDRKEDIAAIFQGS